MSEMADESARKSVSGACRIKNVLQRQSGRHKNLVLKEEQGAMFPFFDDQVTRTHLQDGPGCLNQRILAAELPCLAVVNHEDIDHRQQPVQIVKGVVHPKVHGIHGNQLRPLPQLFHDADLEAGHHISQHHKLAALVAFRDHRVEICQYVEVSDQRVPGIHVEMVPAFPEKGLLVLYDLYALEVDAAFLQLGHLFLREIIPDDGDLVDGTGEIA